MDSDVCVSVVNFTGSGRSTEMSDYARVPGEHYEQPHLGVRCIGVATVAYNGFCVTVLHELGNGSCYKRAINLLTHLLTYIIIIIIIFRIFPLHVHGSGVARNLFWGYIFFWGGIKLQYSCSVAFLMSFLPHKKFTWTFGPRERKRKEVDVGCG